MNCRDARLRITGSLKDQLPIEHDKELVEHLQNCPECAADASISESLKNIIKVSGQDDLSEMIPIEVMRERVESATPSQRSLSTPRFTLRPALTISAFAVAALIALTLIPFSYQQTIGYSVSFAGVNRDLVSGDDRLCGMLADMELYEAAVDVLGCDTTCSVLVLDLKSQREAQMVVSAVADENSYDLKTDIIAVKASRSESLFDRVNNRLSKKYGDL